MSNVSKTPARKLESMARSRAKRNADPIRVEKNRAYQAEYRINNAERIAAQQAERQRALSVEIRLKRKGLDPKEYAEVIKSHPGFCDLCGKPPDGKWKKLNIDHCHTTKAFRGILCANCNRAIGYFADDPKLMRKAASYVETSRKTLPGENIA